MTQDTQDAEDPSSMTPTAKQCGGNDLSLKSEKLIGKKRNIFARLKDFIIKPKQDSDALKEALEEYIEEMDEEIDNSPIAAHERAMISNVLELRNTTVIDVMIPRADIAAIEVGSSKKELLEMLAEKQFSRIPVYRETMDDLLGTVHIKDILAAVASDKSLDLKSMIRPVPIVSPSLPVLDLLLKMQMDKKHMLLVVDEYGGIDGLVTIGDVIEAIVGEFDDEFDQDIPPQMSEESSGSVLADARLDIECFEEKYGNILTDEEREEVDTLGGLVFHTANRIPSRGEVIKHESGMVFEILEADQRRINRLRIRNIPS